MMNLERDALILQPHPVEIDVDSVGSTPVRLFFWFSLLFETERCSVAG